MPPLPLLIALMMAFALGDQFPGPPVARSELLPRILEMAGALFLAATTSLGVGLGLASSIKNRASGRFLVLRFHSALASAVSIMNLGVYAWILFGLGWVTVVRGGLQLGRLYLVDEIVILLPYMLAECAGWCGLYPASRALGVNGTNLGLPRYLLLRFRLTFGLVLPPLLVFALLGELSESLIGKEWSNAWWFEAGSVLVIGVLVMGLSPAFVRLALSTHRLPDGPLRDQLERQGKRLGFRSTDILVWETHGAILNAVVTGLFPWYRYVLLSDGLLEHMEPGEIAAIYGHEVGHIRHRHFAMFGIFMIGSTGVLALLFQPLETHLEPVLARYFSAVTATVTIDIVALFLLGAYFFFAFGWLSRLLERQADVYGCRAVSCGEEICPPHSDVDQDEFRGAEATQLCPAGIHLFTEALRRVALMNGIDLQKFSWRHGSISRRIDFLESLTDSPQTERAFQSRVRRLTGLMVVTLILSLILAASLGAFDASTLKL